MRHRSLTSTLLGLVALGAFSIAPAWAQFVTPASYSYSTPPEGQAQGGGFNYFDDTGSQLTDGVIGADNWAADLGNGAAYEWVGWRNGDPTITFNFGTTVNITQFQIGLNNFISGGVSLPTTVTIDGTLYNLGGNEVTAGQRGFINFNQAFTGTTLQINLADGGSGNWIFTDEIRFVGSNISAAPEPGTLALLGIGLALGGYGLRRKR